MQARLIRSPVQEARGWGSRSGDGARMTDIRIVVLTLVLLLGKGVCVY